jgi:UDP-glucuronate 4-epimerase
MTILLTGSAGFIGFHVAQRLLDQGDVVVGVDNMAPYDDPQLKAARRGLLERRPAYRHAELNLADRTSIAASSRKWARRG